MRATGPRKMETYRVKICDSEEAGNTIGEQGKWLRISCNDDTRVSLKELKEFSGEKCFGNLRVR